MLVHSCRLALRRRDFTAAVASSRSRAALAAASYAAHFTRCDRHCTPTALTVAVRRMSSPADTPSAASRATHAAFSASSPSAPSNADVYAHLLHLHASSSFTGDDASLLLRLLHRPHLPPPCVALALELLTRAPQHTWPTALEHITAVCDTWSLTLTLRAALLLRAVPQLLPTLARRAHTTLQPASEGLVEQLQALYGTVLAQHVGVLFESVGDAAVSVPHLVRRVCDAVAAQCAASLREDEVVNLILIAAAARCLHMAASGQDVAAMLRGMHALTQYGQRMRWPVSPLVASMQLRVAAATTPILTPAAAKAAMRDVWHICVHTTAPDAAMCVPALLGDAFRSLALAACRRQDVAVAAALMNNMLTFAARVNTWPNMNNVSGATVLAQPVFVEALCACLRSFATAADDLSERMYSHTQSSVRAAEHLVVPEKDVVLLGGTRLVDAKRRAASVAASAKALPAPAPVPQLTAGAANADAITALSTASSPGRGAGVDAVAAMERAHTRAWLTLVERLASMSQPTVSNLAYVYDVAIMLSVRSRSMLALRTVLDAMASSSAHATTHGLGIVTAARTRAVQHAQAHARKGTTGGALHRVDDAPLSPEPAARRIPVNTVYVHDARYVGWDAAADGSTAPGAAVDGAVLLPPPVMVATPAQWDALLRTAQQLCTGVWMTPAGAPLADMHTVQRPGAPLPWVHPYTPEDVDNVAAVAALRSPASASTEPVSVAVNAEPVAPHAATRARLLLATGHSFADVQRAICADAFVCIMHAAHLQQLSAAIRAFTNAQLALDACAAVFDEDAASFPASKPHTLNHRALTRVYDAVIAACMENGQPQRALKFASAMIDAQLTPTRDTVHLIIDGLVGPRVSPIDRAAHVDTALVWFDYGRRSSEALPVSSLTALLGALCDARRSDVALRMMRNIQREAGQLGFVDARAHAGVFNVSSLPPALIAAVLYDGLRALRDAVHAHAIPPPASLRVYHSPADRLHIRGLLQALTPPLMARTWGIGHEHRHLYVPSEALIAFLTTPTGADEMDTPRMRIGRRSASDSAAKGDAGAHTRYLSFTRAGVTGELEVVDEVSAKHAVSASSSVAMRSAPVLGTAVPTVKQDALNDDYNAWHLQWQRERARARSATRAAAVPSSSAPRALTARPRDMTQRASSLLRPASARAPSIAASKGAVPKAGAATLGDLAKLFQRAERHEE